MLSPLRCLYRTSLSVARQGHHALARRSASGLSAFNWAVDRTTKLRPLLSSANRSRPPLSSADVFPARYFKTSAVLGSEVITVKAPAFPESITEGYVKWQKSVGDSLAEDEVVCEIETEKITMHVVSPADGVLEELFVAVGARVEAGMPLFKLRRGAARAATRPAPDTPAAEAPAPGLPSPPTPVSAAVPVPAARPTRAEPAPAVFKPSAVPAGARTESRVKMTRMRLRVAQRLKEAQNTCAMLTTFNEVDVSNVQEMRSVHKDAFLKKHGVKLGFMSVFVKATAHALHDQPVLNAAIDDTTKEIVYRDYVDVSVAVATPKGLVVPVLRHVETMNLADIERTLSDLGEKARRNELAVEDMDGGTFTVSNGGVFGSLFSTPIINPPQSAILGMHGVFDRPVAVRGKVEVRPMMYVALTYDHRLVDGREAVTFLRKIKAVVEDPLLLLLDM